MLGHTHTPENHTRLRAGKGARHIAQHIGLNAADLGHFLGRKIFEMGFLGLPVFGVGINILLIIKPLFDDHMHDRIEHRYICTGPKLQHMRCKAA